MIPIRIIIHCSDTPNGKRAEIETIRQDHIKNRGFSDIGYHLLIQPDGEVQRGRGLNEQGAHCEGENFHSIGICLVGTDKYTRRAFAALRYQLDSILMTHPQIKKWEIRCHREFESAIKQGKTCPDIPPGVFVAWYVGQLEDALEPYLMAELP